MGSLSIFPFESDVVYDPDIIGCLASLLVKLLNRKPEESHPEVYIASTIRNPKTYDCFKNELGEFNVHTCLLPF